jgi:ribonucleoside-diphosphate reductase alpha chain
MGRINFMYPKEIVLPTDEHRTFVCCLSSLNLDRFEEWKDTNIVQDLIRFLDNVLQFFISNAPDALQKAKFSAERERALGLGTFGWHALLQQKGIAFESGGFNSAVQLTHQVFSLVKSRAVEESKRLAEERGEALDMVGTGLRNSRLLSIAPNANSSDLAGTSPSIEPYYRNIFQKDTRAGSFVIKNPYLEKLLEEKGCNTKSTWADILANNGSVQHLDFLSEHEKNVFKTAMELDQHWLVELANQRGGYICQAQSLNLFFPAGVSREYVNSVHLKYLNSPDVLTLYYFRTERESKVDTVKNIERKALTDWKGEDCVACQG